MALEIRDRSIVQGAFTMATKRPGRLLRSLRSMATRVALSWRPSPPNSTPDPRKTLGWDTPAERLAKPPASAS
jgi:hypothetical protein